MAVMLLLLAGAVLWLEVVAMRRVGRTSFHEARAADQAPPGPSIEDLLVRTATEIATLLDLRACWFEPFPFDALLPRIELGRIVLPTPEPGVAPCSDVGVELPVRVNELNVGRFVLIPPEPSVGVIFSPSARDRAIALAAQAGAALAAALVEGDAPLRSLPASRRSRSDR